MQVPRPFAVFFPQRPFGVQNCLGNFLLSFFLEKDGKKSRTFFCPPKGCQKDTKKMPKGQQPFLDAKRFPSKKVGKKSWHLHSPLVNRLVCLLYLFHPGFNFSCLLHSMMMMSLFHLWGNAMSTNPLWSLKKVQHVF